MEIEQHPLEPFLPGNARLLMLGSFPPQRKRWSMEFYYPNWNNDMWRIAGLLFFNDKDHFADKSQKAFRKERIIDFLNEKGIALFDTATAVRRLQDNASEVPRSGPTHRHIRIIATTATVQSDCHYGTKSYRYALCAVLIART